MKSFDPLQMLTSGGMKYIYFIYLQMNSCFIYQLKIMSIPITHTHTHLIYKHMVYCSFIQLYICTIYNYNYIKLKTMMTN